MEAGNALDELAARWRRTLLSVRWAHATGHRSAVPGFHHIGMDHYSLYWCRRGAVTLTTIDGPTVLGPGAAALLPPHCVRTEDPAGPPFDADGRWELLCFGIAGQTIDATPSPFELLPLPATWQPDCDALWLAAWDQLLKLRPLRHPINRCAVRGPAEALLWSAARSILTEHAPLQTPPPVWLAAVRERLSSLQCDDDLEALAALAGVSVNHLIRTFKAAHGCTPAAWNRRVRLDQAARLLTDLRDEPIREIARRCGYRNLKAFTKAFGRRHGCPPRAWRAGRGPSVHRS